MEYYGNILAVTVEDLTRSDDGDAVMTLTNYRNLTYRKVITILRSGKGLGNYALIEYASLPARFRERFEAKYGDPEKMLNGNGKPFTMDAGARRFFNDYLLPDGSHIPESRQKEYVTNASVLGALLESYNTQKAMRRVCNNNTPIIWGNIFAHAEELRETVHHTLPKSEARLRDKMREFQREGYACLVSGKFGNRSASKITEEAGRLIIALRRSRTPVYSIPQLLEEFNRRAASKGWKPLRSQSSLMQFLERPEVKPQWYDAVYGELAAKQLYSRHHKTEMPSMRDSLWYGDGTKLNLFYKDYENGKLVLKTAMVYEVADAFNDTLLGYCISRTEDFAAQYRAFRMAVRTSGHLPYEIVTDNQGGQTSKLAKAFFASICRVHRTTAPYNPQSKTIERLFGSFQSQVLAQDWRFTGGNISSKDKWKINREFIEANKEDLYTYAELCEAYAQARERWNAMMDSQRQMARIEAYRSSVNPETQAVSDIDMVNLFWIQTDSPVKFTADGISITYHKQRYTYEVLDSEGQPDYDWRAKNTGREFVVKFDPDDMGAAMLYEQTPLGLRYCRTVYPYITVHRNIQEQQEGEMAFIRMNDERNKLMRVERQIASKALEMEHGTAPEQQGLVSPAIKGITEREYERIADAVAVITQQEPLAIGEYTKAMSNLDYDPVAALDRL